jgi:uncharacterized membrane protein YadS
MLSITQGHNRARAKFVAMMLANSFDLTPPPDKTALIQATSYRLTIAAAAMGFQTDMLSFT